MADGNNGNELESELIEIIEVDNDDVKDDSSKPDIIGTNVRSASPSGSSRITRSRSRYNSKADLHTHGSRSPHSPNTPNDSESLKMQQSVQKAIKAAMDASDVVNVNLDGIFNKENINLTNDEIILAEKEIKGLIKSRHASSLIRQDIVTCKY